MEIIVKVSETDVHVFLMGIVTKGLYFTPLAQAKNIRFVFSCKLNGFELGPFMRSVTEGLLFRQSAGTVEVLFADFELQSIW